VLAVVAAEADAVAQRRPVAVVPQVQRLGAADVVVRQQVAEVRRPAAAVEAVARLTRQPKPRLLRPSERNTPRPRQWS
jgi:hypothetical protein